MYLRSALKIAWAPLPVAIHHMMRNLENETQVHTLGHPFSITRLVRTRSTLVDHDVGGTSVGDSTTSIIASVDSE